MDSRGLLATAGITVPASATLEQVAYLAPARTARTVARAMPIFVHYSGEFPYGRPARFAVSRF